MKVALYARVSTDDKNQNPETQLLQLRQFCERFGWEIYREYVDQARAKDYRHRTDWMELQKSARQRLFSHVLVYKLDRAFRSVRECCNQLQEWDDHGIKFVATTQDIDTSTAMGRYFMHTIAAIAELESSMIGDRVTSGIIRRRAEGKRWGRMTVQEKKGITIVDIKNTVALTGSRNKAAKILKISRRTISRLLDGQKPISNDSFEKPDKNGVGNETSFCSSN